MPTFSHNYGGYSVEGSINYFLKNNLLTNVPSFITPVTGQAGANTLNFDYPEQPLVFPSFAVTHLGNEPIPGHTFQGDKADGAYKGIQKFGMVEIDCWANSKDNFAWMMQLRTMRDMVVKLFQQHRAIALYDLSTPAVPVALSAVTRIMDIKEPNTAPDPNPSVKRKRILVTHHWVERV